MNFHKKTVWITGAASGMGQALAIELADKNTHLIISDRDEAGLIKTAGLIEARGSKASPYLLDMTDQLAIQSIAQTVMSTIDHLDGLYQFAGISQRSLVVETPIENDRKIMEVNFFGVISLAKAVLPYMIDAGGGQMSVTSSLVGKFGFPFRSAYAASKHALHGYFESLRAENSKYNIRVSILIPGRVQTNISKFAIDKNGLEYGKMDPGQANGITAEKAARQILRGLRNENKEIHVGGMELFMLQIRRFFPALLYKLAARIKPV